jgi:hypothetical protein
MNNIYKIDLCTPCLCTFVYTGSTPFQKIYGFHVSSLKHVDIDANIGDHGLMVLVGIGDFLYSWFLEFGNIKSLTVSAATPQVP